MRYIIEFFSDPVVIFSFITLLSLAIITVVHFQINIGKMAKEASEKALKHRLRVDREKTRKREQLSKIGKKESVYIKKYRMAVTSIKIALNLSFLSVENFTTLFILFGFVVWAIASFLLNNVFLGFLVSVPSILAFLSFLLVITKRKIRANDNAVMDALDAICPMVNVGIENAIRMNLESFDRRIRHHFEWFISAVRFQGYDFNEAIDELAVRLGPRFDEFARKAKIFEENYREGMEDIFKDIIEMNNDVRSDNMEMDEISRRVNNKLLTISCLLIGFLGYMYIAPSTRTFMLDTFLGSLVSAIEVSLLILIYAVSQLMQVEIPDVEDDDKGKRR